MSSEIFVGIDPGPKYTGVVVRQGDEVLYASTFVRPKEMLPITWAVTVTNRVLIDVIANYPDAKVGIEGVTVPNAYNGGKLAMINPKSTIHLGIVVGAFAMALPNAVIVRPGKNGSQEIYPECLSGRRPKELAGTNAGAGTRNHEKSAYDVAGLAEGLHNDRYKLDEQQNLFD